MAISFTFNARTATAQSCGVRPKRTISVQSGHFSALKPASGGCVFTICCRFCGTRETFGAAYKMHCPDGSGCSG